MHPRLRANELVGTDLVQALPLVAAAAAGHLVVGDARLGLAATVLIGALPGVYVGATLSARASGGLVRWAVAIVLLASGLKLWSVSTTLTVLACGALAAGAAIGTTLHRRRTRARTAPTTTVVGMPANRE